MQPGPNAFDKAGLLMTFLTNLGVILCSLRLVLEGKTYKEVPESWKLEFLELFFQMQETARPGRLVERYARFIFVVNNVRCSPKVTKARFLRNDRLFCFIIICKFSSFKNSFAIITSLSRLYFRFRRFILLVQVRKVVFITCGSSTSNIS